MSEGCPTATEQANHTIRGDSSRRKGLEPPTEPPTEPPVDSYGYILGSYYLTGTINGVDCGVTNVDPDMLFLRDTGDQMILSHVVFKQGDVVKHAAVAPTCTETGNIEYYSNFVENGKKKRTDLA